MTDHRWAMGHVSVATLDTTYALVNFPVQTDQKWEWFEPQGDSDLYQPFVQREEAWDGSIGGFGSGKVQWILGPLSPGMVAYLYVNRFSSALSALATIRTRNPQSLTNEWVVLHCTAQWFDITQVELQYPAIQKVPFVFTRATVVAP